MPKLYQDVLVIGVGPVVSVLALTLLVLIYRRALTTENLYKFQGLVTGGLTILVAWPSAVIAFHTAIVPLVQAEQARVEQSKSERSIGKAIIATAAWDLANSMQRAFEERGRVPTPIQVPAPLLDKEVLRTQDRKLADHVAEIVTLIKIYNVSIEYEAGDDDGNKREISDNIFETTTSSLFTMLECISPALKFRYDKYGYAGAQIHWDSYDDIQRAVRENSDVVGIHINRPPIFSKYEKSWGIELCKYLYD